ncbi:hypothetical protein [Arenimonas fontis]|uniref:Uncharacterized protein n=1 Tax=Arenimonas fontis TaxID=2608255 RepID=A0A5B2ZF26_9GAMM|nr:hypothetical protein [Arenimonas fontis]KAA2285681.1 hypothetical protein F0415_03385 [Arenimonas fontis]
MALDPATEKHLRETFGDALEQYLQQEFSFGVAQPTEGEAAPISLLKFDPAKPPTRSAARISRCSSAPQARPAL